MRNEIALISGEKNLGGCTKKDTRRASRARKRRRCSAPISLPSVPGGRRGNPMKFGLAEGKKGSLEIRGVAG